MTTNQLTLTITHLRVHCCARAFTHPILMILKSSVEGVFSIVNRIQRSEHQCFFLKAQGLHIGLSYATSTVCLVLYVWNEGCGQMQSTVLKVCTVILLKKKGAFSFAFISKWILCCANFAKQVLTEEPCDWGFLSLHSYDTRHWFPVTGEALAARPQIHIVDW